MKRSFKLYITVVAFLSGMVLFSCTDLTEDTTGLMTAESFYSDPGLIPQAVGATYSELQGYQNHWGVWGLNTVSSDECVVPTRVPGNDWYDGGIWQAFHKHEWQTNLDALNKVWRDLFSGVTTCNRVILDLETYKNSMEQSVYDKYRAETLILHSYYYSLILDLFGNVPYVDKYESEITSYEQIPRAVLYNKIVTAVESNIEFLDAEPTAENYGHCTKAMAYTLLAKLYLNSKIYKGESSFSQSDMNNVIEYCDKVIDLGHYEIVSDFKEPFKVSNESCKENIFVIPFENGISTRGGDYEFHFHKFSGHSKFRQIYALNTGGWNGGCATPGFMALYDDSDIRKKATFIYGLCYTPEGVPIENSDDKPNQLELTIEVTSIEAARKWDGARIQKYEYERGMSGRMNNDFVLFRLADIYYMKAEAILRGGNSSLSDLCNDTEFRLIRERAGMSVYTPATLTLDELIDERGREFAWEGMRRTDLVRWDKFAKGAWDFKTASSDNSRDLFPIPYDQISKNPSWIQNAGY